MSEEQLTELLTALNEIRQAIDDGSKRIAVALAATDAQKSVLAKLERALDQEVP